MRPDDFLIRTTIKYKEVVKMENKEFITASFNCKKKQFIETSSKPLKKLNF